MSRGWLTASVDAVVVTIIILCAVKFTTRWIILGNINVGLHFFHIVMTSVVEILPPVR